MDRLLTLFQLIIHILLSIFIDLHLKTIARSAFVPAYIRVFQLRAALQARETALVAELHAKAKSHKFALAAQGAAAGALQSRVESALQASAEALAQPQPAQVLLAKERLLAALDLTSAPPLSFSVNTPAQLFVAPAADTSLGRSRRRRHCVRGAKRGCEPAGVRAGVRSGRARRQRGCVPCGSNVVTGALMCRCVPVFPV
jgi:hypothetical protein